MKNNDVSRLISEKNLYVQKLQQIVKETIDAEKLIVENLLYPPVK
jgi:hypothetical protein